MVKFIIYSIRIDDNKFFHVVIITLVNPEMG